MTLETLRSSKYKNIFYGKGKENFDQETVAYSIVVVNDGHREEFLTTSSSGDGHAEDSFLTQVQTLLRKFQIKKIEITIMLSKSPCWKCRENLEACFESLTKKGVTVIFVLRIADLYYGKDRCEEPVVENLALWFRHIITNNIVSEYDIQPISVTTELHEYSPRLIDIAEWNATVKKRSTADRTISDTVNNIKRKIEDNLEPTPLSISNLANVIKKLVAKEKQLFYKSTSTNRHTQIFVAIAQVQLYASNTVGRTKKKEFQVIIKQTEKAGCCHLNFEGLLTERLSNEDKYEAPASWTRVSRKILLALTHFPCGNCVKKITTVIRELKPRLLVLRVANINLDERAFISDWLYQRCREGLDIRLEAISVVTELGTVYCKRGATDDEAADWKRVFKEGRPGLDVMIIDEVRRINTEISDKILFEDEAERLSKIQIN